MTTFSLHLTFTLLERICNTVERFCVVTVVPVNVDGVFYHTPVKFNMEPENLPSKRRFLLETTMFIHFQVPVLNFASVTLV